jgi:hypothetical protein
LSSIGKAGLQASGGLAIHHRHFMTLLGEIMGGRDADNAAAENENAQGSCPSGMDIPKALAEPLCTSAVAPMIQHRRIN